MAQPKHKYQIGDILFIVTDPEQAEGIVTAVTWWGGNIWSYTVVFGFDTFDIREECLSKNKRFI